MEIGKQYRLDPPLLLGGKTFLEARCVDQVPNQPNVYIMRGVPDEGDDEETFGFNFTHRGKTRVVPIDDSPPHLRLVC